jgi:hypothetical protein
MVLLPDRVGFPEPNFKSPPLTSEAFGHYLAPGKYFLCDLSILPGPSKLLSEFTVCRILPVNNQLGMYQSSTSLNLLSANLILPAFVLSENELVDCPRIPPLVGMASIFLLRYRTDGTTVPHGLCLSFPTLYEHCKLKSTFTQGCFNDMLPLRASVNMSICWVGLQQGSFCCTFVKCAIQPSTW